MYRQLLYVAAVFCGFFVLTGCIEHDYTETASSGSLSVMITGFAVSVPDFEEGSDVDFVAEINQSESTIHAYAPLDTIGPELQVHLTTFSGSRVVSPDITKPVNFQDPVAFIVESATRGERVRREYTVKIEIPRPESGLRFVFNEDQLRQMGRDPDYPLDGSYHLMNSIELTGDFDPIGSIDAPFTGHFDGKGKEISNLRISQTSSRYVGLFAQIGNSDLSDPDNNGVVRDLTLALAAVTVDNPSSISGEQYVGALAGASYGHVEKVNVSGGLVAGSAGNVGGLIGINGGTITKSRASSTVEGRGGSNVGGLAGNNSSSGTITDSYANGTTSEMTSVTLTSIGGLVGNNDGTIEKSFAKGEVIASGSTNVGGLVGIHGSAVNTDAEISESYAAVDVEGQGYVGAFVGLNYAHVSDSYAAGSVEGNQYVGSFVGLNTSSIGRCYTIAVVVNWLSDAGIFAGGNSGTITDSYYARGSHSARGLAGPNSAFSNAGSSTSVNSLDGHRSEDITQNQFKGWNFSDAVWRWMDDGRWPQLAVLSGQNTRIVSGLWEQNEAAIPIGDEAALRKIGRDLDYPLYAHYELTNNITLSGDFIPRGSNHSPFTGSFDGKGNTISNLKIPQLDDYSSVGLFTELSTGAIVENLTLSNATLRGNENVGALVGINHGTVENLTLRNATLRGNEDVGALVGINYGTARNSRLDTMKVEGNLRVGGLAGDNHGLIEGVGVSDSDSDVDVTGIENVGGLVGFNNSGTIRESYAAVVVEGDTVIINGLRLGGIAIGGLVGNNNGSGAEILDSYATGTVTGPTNVGGLVGSNLATISNSYATGSVTGTTSVGGLVGFNDSSRTSMVLITSSYFDSSTDSTGKTPGVGSGPQDGVTGYRTASLQQSSFGGFDFDDSDDDGSEDIWIWSRTGQWPFLAWK